MSASPVEIYATFGQAKLGAPLGAADMTLTVQAGHTLPTTYGQFRVTLPVAAPGLPSEILLLQSPPSGLVYTVLSRAAEGPVAALSYPSGTAVFSVSTAAALQMLKAPVFLADLRSIAPTMTRQVIETDGRAVSGDGGGGQWDWNAADTRADDDGTVVKVTSITTGRWNRRFAGSTLDARWFGGVADNATDNTVAIFNASKAAYALAVQFEGSLPPSAYPGFSLVNILLTAGAWVVSGAAGQAGIELPPCVGLVGEGAFVRPSTSTCHAVRISTLRNKIRGIVFVGGNCAVVECGPTRYPATWNAWAGSLGTLIYEGVNHIDNCSFQAQHGPSLYTDTTLENRDAASSMVVSNSEIITSSAAWVNQDDVTFLNCYIQIDQSGGSWVPQAVDDNGHILPAFTSMNQLKLVSCEMVPIGHSSLSGLTSCWLAGFGQFKSVHTRFGGESTFVTIRTTTTKYTYNGVTPSSLYNPQGQQPTIDFDADGMASNDQINWMECYDVFPLWINVRNFSPSTYGPGTPPNPRVLLMQSLGVWIDATTCPTSSYLKSARESILIKIDPFTTGPDFRFRTSTNPALLLGAAGVTDVTAELRRYMVGDAVRGPVGGGIPTLGAATNLWASGILQLSQASTTTAVGLATGAVDTSTGYSIQGYHFTGASASGVFGFNNAIPASLPAGEYTISVAMKSAFAARLGIYLTDATGGTNPIALDSLDFSDGDWQRLETTFYWDGTTYSGGSGAGVTFQIGGVPASEDFFISHFALHAGRGARAWHFPGNANLSNYIVDEYEGTTTPTAGTYKLGDRIWNTNTVVGQPVGWVCIRGGDYAGPFGTAPLWSSFGTINFDPSQIASYNFDYDAAILAPGAITTWPSKYGGMDTVASFTLSGTATAHAAGGTGPNGAAYVSGNGTSDFLTEDNQSSSIVAQELYIVAKYDTSGGASGTLWDGGVTNTGRIYRPSAGNVELLLSGSLGPAACSDTEIWAIWHVVADGTNGQLDVNGVAILASQPYATTFLNGITMFDAGNAGGDYAQASIARAIGFTPALTSTQRTQMANYLKTLYGVT